MGVIFGHKGSFKNLEKFLTGYSGSKIQKILDTYGEEGVRALSAVTPVDTGLTAGSWNYKTIISSGKGEVAIEWYNTNRASDGTPVVVLLHYGHGTKGGAYVKGRNFIVPAIEPLFDKISAEIWEVIRNG